MYIVLYEKKFWYGFDGNSEVYVFNDYNSALNFASNLHEDCLSNIQTDKLLKSGVVCGSDEAIFICCYSKYSESSPGNTTFIMEKIRLFEKNVET